MSSSFPKEISIRKSNIWKFHLYCSRGDFSSETFVPAVMKIQPIPTEVSSTLHSVITVLVIESV